jgi:hypothetical protein
MAIIFLTRDTGTVSHIRDQGGNDSYMGAASSLLALSEEGWQLYCKAFL